MMELSIYRNAMQAVSSYFSSQSTSLLRAALFSFFACSIFVVILLVLMLPSVSMFLLISGSVHPNPGSICPISVLASMYGFDVFTFLETWLNSSGAYDSIVIPGYSYPLKKDKAAKLGRGVLLFVPKLITNKRRVDC